MKEIRATSFLLILMVATGMTVFPAHAQVDFDIICFLQCVGTCIATPTPKLLCISTCITTCYKPAPVPPAPVPPAPAPVPPLPVPPAPAPSPPAPPNPKKQAPPKPPHMFAFPPQTSLGMKSCNFLYSVQECAAINTEIEKLKCLESCSRVACED